MRRIVSVWLPDWPITVWSRAAGPPSPPEAQAPFALVERAARGLVLTAADPAARAHGLRRGQTHADARAILPSLESAPADPERDRAAWSASPSGPSASPPAWRRTNCSRGPRACSWT